MNRSCVALPIAADHPAFAGHFPGSPIVPGVVLLDEVLHALGVALGKDFSCCTISSAKFLQAVGPGDELELQYEVAAQADKSAIRFEIVCADRKIASGVLNFPQPA